MLRTLHHFAKIELVNHTQEGFDDWSDCCLTFERLSDERVLEDHVVSHMSEHGLKIFSLHRIGEGVEMIQIHEFAPIQQNFNCTLKLQPVE
jgi:hypothetical protein